MFCEGIRTEPEYIEALRREPAVRDSASVEIQIDRTASGAVPLTLVNKAAKARDRYSQEQGEIDEVWCLFDVEWPQNHPKLHEARTRAKARNVNLAISNPCFELWLVLHFEERTAWLNSDNAGKLRSDHERVQVRDWRAPSTCPGEPWQRDVRVRWRPSTQETEPSFRTTIHRRACTFSWRRSSPTGKGGRSGQGRFGMAMGRARESCSSSCSCRKNY